MDLKIAEALLKEKIRDLPDWPQKGVIFRDITTVLKDPEAFQTALEALYELVKDLDFTKIIAIESRGFIFGSALAYKMNKGFVPVRKPGKLPCKVINETYSLEYGTDTIEIHEDAVDKGEKVIILDDLIATGGSAQAAVKLIEKLGGQVEAAAFLIELSFFNGREKLTGCNVKSVIVY